MNKTKTKIRIRNPIAYALFVYGGGAGKHKDLKKDRSRNACRGKHKTKEESSHA